eukprot:COSAG05_NODE_2137_length_3497_cov_1.466451_2_plen_140_part_00
MDDPLGVDPLGALEAPEPASGGHPARRSAHALPRASKRSTPNSPAYAVADFVSLAAAAPVAAPPVAEPAPPIVEPEPEPEPVQGVPCRVWAVAFLRAAVCCPSVRRFQLARSSFLTPSSDLRFLLVVQRHLQLMRPRKW